VRSVEYCCIIFCVLLCFNNIVAQPVVGLQKHTKEAFEGYILFAPGSSKQTFLIDNCGYVVNVWNCSDVPNLSVYLLEDGSLLRASLGFIEKLNWDSELLWYFNYKENNLDVWPHHDIEPLPNGNVLAIAARSYSAEQGIRNGRNPNTITNELQIDGILEIEPTGKFTGELVWEWNAFDHIVQDFDSTKFNYGNVAENKGKLDINYSLNNDSGLEDWLHLNAVEYNTDLDQILFSSRSTSEIYIIDHSTTAEQVKTNKGGKSGKGGDFLWRWGNPLVYKSGTQNDRMLFGQHDSKWIPEGHPDEGKISVFNNGFQREGDYSSIHILQPVFDNEGNYQLANNKTFAPSQFEFTWQGNVLNEKFWGPIESGVHSLPNGNLMICEVSGRFFEVNPYTNEVVWIYKNPVGEKTYYQYQLPEKWTSTFRAEKYAINYTAFTDKNLEPKFLLEEQNNLSESCSTPVNINNAVRREINFIQQKNVLVIQSKQLLKQIKIFNLNGELLRTQNSKTINFGHPGIYLLHLSFDDFLYIKKIITF